MFKVVGIIVTIAGIFWLGDTVGVEGVIDFAKGFGEVE